jgi:hypothetical protein
MPSGPDIGSASMEEFPVKLLIQDLQAAGAEPDFDQEGGQGGQAVKGLVLKPGSVHGPLFILFGFGNRDFEKFHALLD